MSARKHVGWSPCSGGQIGCPAGILYREREENQSIFREHPEADKYQDVPGWEAVKDEDIDIVYRL